MKAKRQDDGTIPAMDLTIPFFGYKSHVYRPEVSADQEMEDDGCSFLFLERINTAA